MKTGECPTDGLKKKILAIKIFLQHRRKKRFVVRSHKKRIKKIQKSGTTSMCCSRFLISNNYAIMASISLVTSQSGFSPLRNFSIS